MTSAGARAWYADLWGSAYQDKTPAYYELTGGDVAICRDLREEQRAHGAPDVHGMETRDVETLTLLGTLCQWACCRHFGQPFDNSPHGKDCGWYEVKSVSRPHYRLGALPSQPHPPWQPYIRCHMDSDRRVVILGWRFRHEIFTLGQSEPGMGGSPSYLPNRLLYPIQKIVTQEEAFWLRDKDHLFWEGVRPPEASSLAWGCP